MQKIQTDANADWCRSRADVDGLETSPHRRRRTPALPQLQERTESTSRRFLLLLQREESVLWREGRFRRRSGGFAEMAALPAKDAALITATAAAAAAKKGANLHDPYCLKRVLDDATSEAVLGRGYVENVSLSNLKMAIGVITCAVALAAQFYPKKFPENKTFLIGCIILYVLLNLLLQYIILTKEKQHILFTYPKSYSGTGLAISSKLPRYSDMYTLRIASADPEHIAAHPPVELTKSVTKWFTKDGILAEGIFWDDVESLIDDYENESRKSK